MLRGTIRRSKPSAPRPRPLPHFVRVLMDLTRSLVCRSEAFTKSRTERELDVSSESSESLRLYIEALKKKQTLMARMQMPPYPAAFVAVGKAWPTLENTKPAANAPDAVASNVATERARSRYLSTSVRYEVTIATACSCVISVVIGPSYSLHAIRDVSHVVNLWLSSNSSRVEWPSTKEVRSRADGTVYGEGCIGVTHHSPD